MSRLLFLAAALSPLKTCAQTATPGQITFDFDGATDKRGVPAPWILKVGSGTPGIAVRTRSDDAATRILWVRAAPASFFLGRTDCHFAAVDYPVLEWSWMGVKLPTGGDVRKSSLLPFSDNRNDQALQVLVTFEGNDTLSYMWDSTAPVGTEVKEQNPFSNIKSVVVQSGEGHLREWLRYRRNLVDDYRRLHGKEPGPVIAIAVQTNSNHTNSQSEGFFGPIIASRGP